MRWHFLNQIKKMKDEGLFNVQAVDKLDKIINVTKSIKLLRNQTGSYLIKRSHLQRKTLSF